MKGVILAGGTGSRLMPLTRETNKHLLRVHDRPMIEFPIRTIVEAGIDEILIVTNPRDVGAFVDALGDGSGLGVRELRFAAQPAAAGIADALRYAESFAGGGRVCVILGDNIFGGSIDAHARAFRRQASGARLVLTRVDDPERFGVARFDGPPPEGARRPRLVEVIEKPLRAPSEWVVTGAYFYDADVFDLVRGLRIGARGELEVTDLNNAYIARGDAEYGTLDGWWTDAGTHESLGHAAARVAESQRSQGLDQAG